MPTTHGPTEIAAVTAWSAQNSVERAAPDPAALVIAVVGALVLLNAIAFAQMALDKRWARRGVRRLPEARLIAPAYVGGAPGVWLAMWLLRHKTRKRSFQARLALAALASAALAAGMALALQA